MTFKELEWKKVKELISPFTESWMTSTFGANALLDGYVLFTYFGGRNMYVHYISDFHSDVDGAGQYNWTFTECNNYFDVLRLVPKIKETFLEIKFPGYHNKLQRLQDDF